MVGSLRPRVDVPAGERAGLRRLSPGPDQPWPHCVEGLCTVSNLPSTAARAPSALRTPGLVTAGIAVLMLLSRPFAWLLLVLVPPVSTFGTLVQGVTTLIPLVLIAALGISVIVLARRDRALEAGAEGAASPPAAPRRASLGILTLASMVAFGLNYLIGAANLAMLGLGFSILGHESYSSAATVTSILGTAADVIVLLAIAALALVVALRASGSGRRLRIPWSATLTAVALAGLLVILAAARPLLDLVVRLLPLDTFGDGPGLALTFVPSVAQSTALALVMCAGILLAVQANRVAARAAVLSLGLVWLTLILGSIVSTISSMLWAGGGAPGLPPLVGTLVHILGITLALAAAVVAAVLTANATAEAADAPGPGEGTGRTSLAPGSAGPSQPVHPRD